MNNWGGRKDTTVEESAREQEERKNEKNTIGIPLVVAIGFFWFSIIETYDSQTLQ